MSQVPTAMDLKWRYMQVLKRVTFLMAGKVMAWKKRMKSSTFVIMTKDRSILAKFKPITYEVSIASSLGGRVEGAGILYGESIQLSAIPDPENQFLGWIINGEDWGEEVTIGTS